MENINVNSRIVKHPKIELKRHIFFVILSLRYDKVIFNIKIRVEISEFKYT